MAASADNMLLGAGIPYFDRIDREGNFTGERDLGHFSSFSLTTAVEKITKYSNRQAARRKYKEVIKQIDASAKGQMDEFDPANLALALYGEEAVIQQAAETAHVTKFTAKKDRWYKLEGRDVENVLLGSEKVIAAPAVAASHTTSFTADNSNLTFTSTRRGTIGNQVKVEMLADADQTLVVTVAGNIVSVQLETDSSAVVISTAAEVIAAINADDKANLILTASLAISSDGTGITEAMAATALSGGIASTGYLLGTDYSLDAATGRIEILPKGAIVADTEVTATYDIPEKMYVAINGASVGEIRGRLRFVGDPSAGTRYEGEFWNVSVSPEGDLALIGADDFASTTLNFSIEDDSKNHPEYPLYRLVQF